MAKRMDKLALVRSMHTRGNDHPQATHYAITGHEVNPAMQFPSLGSIITKETGPAQRRSRARSGAQVGPKPAIRRIFPRGVSRRRLRSDVHSRPEPAGFPSDGSEPSEDVSQAAVESRSAFLNVVDRHYRA